MRTRLVIVLCSMALIITGMNSSRAQDVPECIVLNVTADPSASMAVSWRTGITMAEGYGEIAEADASPEMQKKAVRVVAKSYDSPSDTIRARFYSVIFEHLRPNTRYAYRVGNKNSKSEWFHVKTAGMAGEPLSFIYLGDAQNDIKSLWSRTIRAAYAKLPEANLIIHAGDLVNRGNEDNEWKDFFYAGAYIHSTIPGLMSPGNHEHSRDAQGEFSVLTPLWRDQFTLPENGPVGLEETCYFSDIQGVRFISLNSQKINLTKAGAQLQLKWLDSVLSNNPNKWTCITFHHPVKSVKASRDNPRMHELFQPLFDKYGVDLVLQGHDHAYARGIIGNVKDSTGRKLTRGTMYVVSVSGPKMYETSPQQWIDRSLMDTQLFQLVHINGNKLSFETYTATGQLFDSFVLVKVKGGKNKLVETR